MDVKLNFSPFREYWLNCYFNMVFSILIPLEPSYKMAACMNDYKYDIAKEKTNSNTEYYRLAIYNMNNFNFNEIFFRKDLYFRDNNDFLEIFKDMVSNGRIFVVGVDLFNWVPNSVCWNKHHWNHYSFINGYNNTKKIFYVFDEDFCGYNEFEIPEERFSAAIRSSYLDPHGYEFIKPDKIEKYCFSIEQAKENAIQLLQYLQNIEFEPLWDMSEDDFSAKDRLDLHAMYLFQIANRHKANEILFNEIANFQLIEDIKKISQLVAYSQELQKGWTLLKNTLAKTYYSPNPKANIGKLYIKCKEMFAKEREMWKVFLSSIDK